jgi:hypothetical protein
MRIEFEMSGGYGGLFAKQPLALRVTVEDLPEDARRELTDLVAASALLEAAGAEPEPRPVGRPDVLQYTLAISQEGQTRRFDFDDVTLPAAARPLVQWLQSRAVEQRAKGG